MGFTTEQTIILPNTVSEAIDQFLEIAPYLGIPTIDIGEGPRSMTADEHTSAPNIEQLLNEMAQLKWETLAKQEGSAQYSFARSDDQRVYSAQVSRKIPQGIEVKIDRHTPVLVFERNFLALTDPLPVGIARAPVPRYITEYVGFTIEPNRISAGYNSNLHADHVSLRAPLYSWGLQMNQK